MGASLLALAMFITRASTTKCKEILWPLCEEIIYCYSVILLSLIKMWKANVEAIYSLVLTSLSRKQPVDLLSVNLFVKS